MSEARARAASLAARWSARLWPSALLLLLAAWLLWPVPRGVMPLSADHTVHLTRIVLTAERLATSGALSGWEPTWFFGFPLGDLYPQLGDLLIIFVHALGLGALDWPSAYAIGFYIVFALQGLVLVRVGRVFGFGPWPGLIAGALALCDAGFTREGGWMYTVYFGVWPQALATSLAYLGLGEIVRALGFAERPELTKSPLLGGQDPAREQMPPRSEATRREAPLRQSAGPPVGVMESPGPPVGVMTSPEPPAGVMTAAICFAAALLAHPIALPCLAIGGVLVLVTLVPRGSVPWRVGVARCLLAGGLGLLLAAWWMVPMLQHKAWMASYGWLFAPLDSMLEWLKSEGRWAQRMPAAVGYLAGGGMLLACLGVGRAARFFALFALVQWLLASSDVFWQLRLDRLGDGFAHIQYQRFLIGAKPGLFLCAGLMSACWAGWAWRVFQARATWRRPQLAIVAALALAPVSVAACAWLVQDSRALMHEHQVGAVQIERLPGEPAFEADYQAFLAWAREQWDTREHDYRIAVRGPRNSHLFMDAPVWTHTPQYKLGFTPGDNFVHKPEAGSRELLDKLGVRWIVSLDAGRPRLGEVARFGRIVVREHPGSSPGLVWLQGGGSVELLDADLRGGLVRARVSDVHLGARVVFAIAGYPRWQLTLDGEPLEWFEDPVLADADTEPVSQGARKAGALRGGKAGGDDGSEPTLIAAEIPAGVREGVLELRYLPATKLERAAELFSLLAWLLVALALWPAREGVRRVPALARALLSRVERRLQRMLHPLAVCVLVPALLGLGYGRWRIAAARESTHLLGWVEAGATTSRNVEPGPVKAEMLIRPAVLMRPRPGKPAVIELHLEDLPVRLHGWAGIDDDQAQEGGRWARHKLRIEVRWSGSPDAKWYEIASFEVPHRAERVRIDVPTGALAEVPVYMRITDEVDGRRVARMGLDLDLQQLPSSGEDDDAP